MDTLCFVDALNVIKKTRKFVLCLRWVAMEIFPFNDIMRRLLFMAFFFFGGGERRKVSHSAQYQLAVGRTHQRSLILSGRKNILFDKKIPGGCKSWRALEATTFWVAFKPEFMNISSVFGYSFMRWTDAIWIFHHASVEWVSRRTMIHHRMSIYEPKKW